MSETLTGADKHNVIFKRKEASGPQGYDVSEQIEVFASGVQKLTKRGVNMGGAGRRELSS